MRSLEETVADDQVLEIVSEIADREGVSPLELPPFYEACAVADSPGKSGHGELQVTYEGYEITVRETGTRITDEDAASFELRA